MTPLRQRMLDAMTVRGLAERTKECYIEAVARLARHYDQSPDLLDPAEVEAYLLHLVKDRKLSYSSVNHAASASRVDWAQAVAGAGGRRGGATQRATVRCAGQPKRLGQVRTGRSALEQPCTLRRRLGLRRTMPV